MTADEQDAQNQKEGQYDQDVLAKLDPATVFKAYLDAVMQAFNKKVEEYYAGAGADPKNKFLHLMDVKNALKSIGSPDTFGIGAQNDYSFCPPPAICRGGDCVGAKIIIGGTEITDEV